MNRPTALAAVERLVAEAGEMLAHDAEIADKVLDEALMRFHAIPLAPFDDSASLESALRLAAALDELTHRLQREQARVGAALGSLQTGRAAAHGYAAQGGRSRFARLG